MTVTRLRMQILTALSKGDVLQAQDLFDKTAEMEVDADGTSADDAASWMQYRLSWWRSDSYLRIKVLVAEHLIERTQRGYYKITEAGMELYRRRTLIEQQLGRYKEA